MFCASVNFELSSYALLLSFKSESVARLFAKVMMPFMVLRASGSVESVFVSLLPLHAVIDRAHIINKKRIS